MNQDTFEKTQFIQIKELLKQYALSNFGKKRIEVLKPSSQLGVVETRLTETSEAKGLLESGLHVPFMGLSNIDHLTQQVEKGFVLEPKELTGYADFLRSNRLIKNFMEKNQFQAPLLARYSETLQTFPEIEDEIYRVIRNNGVDSVASRELRKLRRTLQETEKEIEEKLQKFLRHADNKTKVQEAIIIKKNDRYTVPIKASYKNQVKGTVIDLSAKGTTAFVEPAGVAKLNDRLYQLKMEETAEVYQILSTLTGMIAERMSEIQYNIEVVAEYDMIFARAKYSREIKGIEPAVNDQGVIEFVNVYHPLLGDEAVPLNLHLGTDCRGLTITGPNAGGKTVVLKTLGLIALQTMIGLQVRADEGTNIAIFDQIFVDIGDQQSIENALSTFSGHMHNLSQILNQVKANSLVLFDEIGSGTEPNEGAALAIAIMEAFYQKGAIIVTTTHYGEIKRFSQMHPDFMTAAMAFDAETLTPKYQLIMGETGDSNAFWIANKMHLAPRVIKQAQKYLHDRDYDLEKHHFQQKQVVQPKVLQSFAKGDRVQLLETNQTGIVYAEVALSDLVKVYVEGQLIDVPNRRLTLLQRAADLYPAGYDLDTLFESYQVRKERHDMDRGSKKAQKQLQKAARKRRTENR